MTRTFSRYVLFLAALVFCSFAMTGCSAAASVLHDFTSDGCSLFPDGDREHRGRWCDCCFAHDIAYWRGGTQAERKQADETLRDCVTDRTHNKALAVLMYDGVRTNGHPAFPTWYRWAYGWSYGRGYKALADNEQGRQRKSSMRISRNSLPDIAETDQTEIPAMSEGGHDTEINDEALDHTADAVVRHDPPCGFAPDPARNLGTTACNHQSQEFL